MLISSAPKAVPFLISVYENRKWNFWLGPIVVERQITQPPPQIRYPITPQTRNSFVLYKRMILLRGEENALGGLVTNGVQLRAGNLVHKQ
jgi:hypothetical protein